APKRPRGRRPVAETPGPAAYDAVNAERASGKSLSPARATIGKSPRRCLERQGGVAGPGPTSYNVGMQSACPKPSSPQTTIGHASRELGRLWQQDNGPSAPAFTNANAALSLRHASPRATFGNSPRDCSKFVLSYDVGQALRRASPVSSVSYGSKGVGGSGTAGRRTEAAAAEVC
ncbi:unnamed protein product, partial [Polarella glacialis]